MTCRYKLVIVIHKDANQDEEESEQAEVFRSSCKGARAQKIKVREEEPSSKLNQPRRPRYKNHWFDILPRGPGTTSVVYCALDMH
jgi:hypothetical protein